MEAAERAAQLRRTLTILFFALGSMPLFYCGVAFAISQEAGGQPLVPAFLYALAGVALVTTAALPMVRKAMLPPLPGETLGVDAPAAKGDPLARYQVVCILCWALSESIAIYGLILTILTHDIRYCGAFAALSLFNIVLYRPSGDVIDQLARL